MTAAVRSFSPGLSVSEPVLVKFEREILIMIPGEVLVPKYAKPFVVSISADPRLFSPLFRLIDMANAATRANIEAARTNETNATVARSVLRPLRSRADRESIRPATDETSPGFSV